MSKLLYSNYGVMGALKSVENDLKTVENLWFFLKPCQIVGPIP